MFPFFRSSVEITTFKKNKCMAVLETWIRTRNWQTSGRREKRDRLILLANFFKNQKKNEKRNRWNNSENYNPNKIILRIDENKKNLVSLESMKSIASIKLHYPLFKRRVAIDKNQLENASSWKLKFKRKTWVILQYKAKERPLTVE